jgi:hypothetical protein
MERFFLFLFGEKKQVCGARMLSLYPILSCVSYGSPALSPFFSCHAQLEGYCQKTLVFEIN